MQLMKAGPSVKPVLLRRIGVLLFAFRTHAVLFGFLLLGFALIVLSLFIFVVQRDLDLWLF